MVGDGVPVRAAGNADVLAALAYGNHNSAPHYDTHILHNIYSDACSERAFTFPRSAAHLLAGVRLAPLGVAASPTKVRVINDLTFDYRRSLPSVNKDTDFD